MLHKSELKWMNPKEVGDGMEIVKLTPHLRSARAGHSSSQPITSFLGDEGEAKIDVESVKR